MTTESCSQTQKKKWKIRKTRKKPLIWLEEEWNMNGHFEGALAVSKDTIVTIHGLAGRE